MKILDRYVLSSYLGTFIPAIMILTFVVLLGAICKLAYFISRGLDWRPVVHMFLLTVPQVLTFSIPLSILVSALLVFGRLSSDGEINAMRSSGVHIYRIAMWPLILSAIMTVICLYNINWVVPRGHFKARTILAELKRNPPIEMIEVGRFNESIPGLNIYIGNRIGKQLYDIRVYDSRSEPAREIHAKEGAVIPDPDGGGLTLDLMDVRFEPALGGGSGSGYASRMPIYLKGSGGTGKYTPKATNLVGPELLEHIQHPRRFYPNMDESELWLKVSKWRVEYHERLALSFACLAFMMLAIPLGIKAHRKETSIGAVMGLGLVMVFYLFVVTAESLAERPLLMPHLIVWLPVAANSGLGLWLLRRAA